jgi:hypothetical protein
MAGYMIWPSIVTAVVTGVLGFVALFWGPYRGLKSTDQLRWVLAVLTLLGMSFGSGVVSLDLGNANPTTNKNVYYASHIINGIATLGLVTVTSLGIFGQFDARLIIPALTAISAVFMSVGVFPINSHFDVGLFALVSGIMVLMTSFLFFFIDRMDFLPKLPTSEREPIGRFNGLGWRIGSVIFLWVDFVMFNLTVDTYGTAFGVNASMAIWMALNIAAGIVIFLNWVIVKSVEPVYDGVGFSGRERESTASDASYGSSAVSKRGKV